MKEIENERNCFNKEKAVGWEVVIRKKKKKKMKKKMMK